MVNANEPKAKQKRLSIGKKKFTESGVAAELLTLIDTTAG